MITEVRAVLLTGPCTDDPWLSVFKQSRSVALIEIVTSGGVVGVGETYAGYFFPESVPLIVDYVRPILIHAEAFDGESLDVGVLAGRLRTCCQYWGRTGLGAAVISGIEAALIDLKGKLLDLPAHRLLGSGADTPEWLPAYATGGPSPWPADQLIEKVDFYLGLGFRAFKVASGYLDSTTRQERTAGSPAAAAELEASKLELLRDHVGGEVGILLDGHMGHREGPERWDLETALLVLDAVAPYRPVFFEEPLPYHELDGYAELGRRSAVPVAGGEQLSTFAEFLPFLQRDAFAVAQPDAAWLGMIDFVRVARRQHESGRSVAPHAWGGGAAVLQNVHGAFAAPNTAIVELPPAAGPLHTELWGGALELVDGNVHRPDQPGLGVRLTDAVKRRFPFRAGMEEFSSVPGKLMRS
ncbi:mandelate racemase/muconate lactonizing enzyme family protein [Microlunatus parietis]|uniref:L-alanine-DL-glutamate epimerase-like enolase superfamily enzyme n=1 Tax=Microlunatus parietis TaxID=682979 RepID=A0A7Y9LF11_9ACTN|nr:mandelate racemase/muconate lactonizing enzyme family protein [Microlunatus parietis]NYE74475.1 L-alanine-DL-glutamate epimerase-like enolase superfamily enzyme [Microlunatus parietis]